MFSKIHPVYIFLVLIHTSLSYNYAMHPNTIQDTDPLAETWSKLIHLTQELTPHIQDLFNATEKQDLSNMKLLLNNKVAINSRNSQGETALHSAVRIKNVDQNILNFFIDHKADFNIKNNSGKAPLHTSILFENNKITEFLVHNNADINAKEEHGFTPLSLAVQNNIKNQNNTIIAFLINNKTDLNSKDNNNHTFWHFVAIEGLIKPNTITNTLQYLSDTKIDLRIKDSAGKNIRDYAQEESIRCIKCNIGAKETLFKKILQLQRMWRTPEETEKVKTFLILNAIVGKNRKGLKIPKPILTMIFDYSYIPTQHPVLLFDK